MKKKSIRPMGQITEDLEKILIEMCEDHELQSYEIHGIVDHWFPVHFPSAIPTFADDGTHPVLTWKRTAKED